VLNLSRVVERHAQFQPARPALSFEGATLSYAGLWQQVRAATGALHALGVQRGERIAYLGFNHPDMLALLLGLSRIGAMLVPLNYRLAPPELRAILAHAGASILFAGRQWEAAAQDLARQLPGLRVVEAQAWESLCACAEDPAALQGGDEDPVLLVYTSGTTGIPKGVVHTQQGLLWNAVNAIDFQEIGRADHVLTVLPMFHVGGLCIQTLPALHAGAQVTLHARFDAGRWLHDTARHRPTLALLVPATMRALIDHPGWPQADLASLRMLNTGSSTVPESLIQAFLDRGVTTSQVYGATETGPVSIYLKAEDARLRVGYAGKAGLHVAVRLVGGGGADVARGEVGEIWVKGPSVMQGYWRDPENDSFQDGWFKSGDLASMDEEGFYRVVGRSKEMIISGGENIYPAELEHILAECSEILEAAVVGHEDERWGEIAVAAIQLKPGQSLDEAGVVGLFAGRLARYKHPRRVVFLDSLPRNALGKVQKPVLRQLLAERLNRT
jgi:fatty-acyl-CoA synthase